MGSHLGFRVFPLLAAGSMVVSAACGDDDSNQNQNNNQNQNDQLTYVGSETCEGCHSDIHADFMESGHPFKLNKVEGGQAPTYPHSSVPDTPTGYAWTDVTYVIGGFFWKARFTDSDGWIVTGDEVQYNLADQSWSAYHAEDPPGTKPYNCGKCHTTGWEETGENGPHQDSLPGMFGTFAAPGIQCEECHGPGSAHAAAPSTDNIELDSSSERCGKCHTRDAQNRIEFKGGFVRHHEQYDEWLASPHNTAGIGCNSCHNPHQGVVYFGAAGLAAQCEDCHSGMTVNHNSAATCLDCHMPHSAKSALKSTPYKADVKSHLFAIGTSDATWGAQTYEADGKTFFNGPLTLDYACYGCHQDETGEGGSASMKTMQELSNLATGIHQ